MLKFLFKVRRKVLAIFVQVTKRIKFYEWKVLYQNRFFASKNISIGKMFSIYFDNSKSIVQIGSGTSFRDFCQIRSGTNGNLIIGENVFFNNNCTINCFSGIEIGNDCQFGEAVKFYDVNHNYKNTSKLISEQGYSAGKIKIGSNCWFGSNVVILKNITIGNNVVIGANCLVYKSIPDNSVVTISQNLEIKKII